MIQKDTVQTIIETAQIEEVVGEFVKLNKRGHNYQGLCPFHNEKTPSFVVSPAKGIYKCFGCGKAGTTVNFLMEHENMSYPEALRWLANKYHIEIEEEIVSEEVQLLQSEKESLFAVNEFARKYFTEQLFETDEGKSVGLSYFKERGLDNSTINKFHLGYCAEKWDSFTKKAIDNGYKLEYLEKTGLTSTTNGNHFDKFRGRIIFPIHNLSGRVIGFGGRILTNDKKTAKYLNSPESEIYHKSNTLYGIYFAKNSIVHENNCYLVEGYFDVISMQNAGITNTVASSGTSLTIEQIRMIRRYTNNITIVYDGDAPGIKASFRAIDMILNEGLNVSALLFPEGHDPDSFVRNNNIDNIKLYFKENTKDFLTFKSEILIKDINDDPIKKVEVIKDVVGSISLIQDPISRNAFIKKCLSIFDISESLLISELNKQLRNKFDDTPKRSDINDQNTISNDEVDSKISENIIANDEDIKEREIIRLLLNYGTMDIDYGEDKDNKQTYILAQIIIQELEIDNLNINNPIYNYIFGVYKEKFKEGTVPDYHYFINNSDNKVSSVVINLVTDKYSLSPKWAEKHKIYTKTETDNLMDTVKNAIIGFKLIKLDRQCSVLTEQLKNTEQVDKIKDILEKINYLTEIKKIPANILGKVILRIL